MPLPLSADTQRLIEERMRVGGYASPDDVVRAALESLRQRDASAEFDEGELDALLAEGEHSGTPLDGEDVLAELRSPGHPNQAKAEAPDSGVPIFHAAAKG